MSETKDYVINIGTQFYATKEEFLQEAQEQGVSRRLPSHCLPDGLSVLGSRIWLSHGLRQVDKKKGEDEGEPQHGVIFGWFRPSAIQFIAGPDGEVKYADIIADLEKREQSVEVVSYLPESVERPRKCGFRKVGGTYVVAEKKTVEGESPITELTPPQEFVAHSFRGLLELTPEQVADLEAGRGLSLLVEQECMECGASVMVSPSTVKLGAIALRQIAKGREPSYVLRCVECRNRHRQEQRWTTKALKLVDYLTAEFAGADLRSEEERTRVAVGVSSYLHRRNGDASKLVAHLSEACSTLVLSGEVERCTCADSIMSWVRRRIEEQKAEKAA